MRRKYIHIRFLNAKGYLLLFLILIGFGSCLNDSELGDFGAKAQPNDYKTKNVFIVVVDGLRYSEGWGDSNHENIPRMAGFMAKQGVVNTKFYNMGDTYTSAGHTSLTTGIYQTINNSGKELPKYPSIFQYWNQAYRSNPLKSWVITSKDKLEVLADCSIRSWKGRYKPSANCGFDGLGIGSGYREDSLTLKMVLKILREDHPNLVLINFRDPDYSAHTGNWLSYINGIRTTDEYVYRLWQFLQSDIIYKNTTTLFVTNDHGRHLDNVNDGFAGHGDDCDGCRHIGFFAFGPDFKKDTTLSVLREQIDLPVTVAELLGFTISVSKGKVMTELFEKK